MSTIKITIAGIGGVGGYFGGLLAKHYHNHPDVEVNFVARGAHLSEIKTNGLRVIQGDSEFIARPKIATDNPFEIGETDVLIVCTKSYDLEEMMNLLRPCITNNTVILPLLNGVDSKARIEALYPANTVLDGCVYIVSRLKQQGVVENVGNIQKLLFGLDNIKNAQLESIEAIFKNAGIEVTLTDTISTVVWEKFIFISPTATITSFYNKSIGEILSEKESLEMLKVLIEEVKQIAKAKGIAVADNITELTLNKLKSLPYEATSSMHNDFKNGKPKTELQSLAGCIITEGEKHHIETPTYLKMYEHLKGMR